MSPVKNSANQEPNNCNGTLQGNVLRSIPCAFSAHMNAPLAKIIIEHVDGMPFRDGADMGV